MYLEIWKFERLNIRKFESFDIWVIENCKI